MLRQEFPEHYPVEGPAVAVVPPLCIFSELNNTDPTDESESNEDSWECGTYGDLSSRGCPTPQRQASLIGSRCSSHCGSPSSEDGDDNNPPIEFPAWLRQ